MQYDLKTMTDNFREMTDNNWEIANDFKEMANDNRKMNARGKKTLRPNKKAPNQYSKKPCRIALKTNLPKKLSFWRGKMLPNNSTTACSFIFTVTQYKKIISWFLKTILLCAKGWHLWKLSTKIWVDTTTSSKLMIQDLQTYVLQLWV